MQSWKVVVLVVAPASGLLLIVALIFFKYVFRRSADRNPNQSESPTRHGRFYFEMQHSGKDSKSWDYAPKNNTAVASLWKNKPFQWINHPTLMVDALERGWTAFALSSSNFPVIGASPGLLSTSTKGLQDRNSLPEVTWEIGPATELMQLIRFNPGVLPPNSADAPVQILHSALPLPGPAFGAVSFPQEAYFEIVILAEGSEHRASFGYDYAENEEVTLIPKSSPSVMRSAPASVGDGFENKGKLDSGRLLRLKSYIENKGGLISSNHIHHLHGAGGKEQLRRDMDVVKGCEAHVMALGLTVEVPQPLGLPGTYTGSVGFHSNGQILLNGYPHIERSEGVEPKRVPWAVVNNTLGCGFNPCTSQVFFTLNGERVWELSGSNVVFEHPLYVSIGSNYDATVMVNFGQGPFLYTPANSQRTSHPGSQLLPSRSIISGKAHEESRDLFSMGIVDFSKILAESENGNCSQDLQHHYAVSEAESDLFEIVLEGRNLH